MRQTKRRGIEEVKRRNGFMFILPWLFGVLVFFAIPLLTSMIYSFCNVRFSSDGLSYTFAGLKHYKRLLLEDPNYLDSLLASVTGIFSSLPIIISLSLIIAILLNQKFKGRMFMRAIFFFPVIIASGPVMDCMATLGTGGFTTTVYETGTATSAYMEVIDFNQVLLNLNLPQQFNSLLTDYLSDTFNLIWSCGIQIILFISGLQMIPEQLYEVGKVEGATAWEKFWYITIPSLGQVILLVIIYTMIELFISKSNLVDLAIHQMTAKNVLDYTTAQLWTYFAVVLIIIGIVIGIYNKVALKRWQ